MAKSVIMPALGMDMHTGRVVTWLKREGEEVVRGQPILEIETDKANLEVEAPATGRLADISAAEGEDVPVGRQIAVILEPGDAKEV